MPKPANATQQVVLETIWDLLLRNGRWPDFHELDQHLYRAQDLDAANLLPELPPGLIYGVDTGSIMPIAGTTTIGLTIAGVAATGRADREVNLFLNVVRHAVELQRNHDAPIDQPHQLASLTAADAAALLGLNMPEDAALLKRLGAILQVERWGSTSFGAMGTDAWEARIGREVRRFRHVPDLATYWDRRLKHWLPSEPRPEPKPEPALTVVEPNSAVRTFDEQLGGDEASNHIDVLVIAAIPEEFDAAKAAGTASAPTDSGVFLWNAYDMDSIPPFLRGEYRVDGHTRFTVALARPTQMGGRATGTFATSLVDHLQPSSLVMCGVCAGNPTDTALGDVVVGEPVYEWDEGKLSPSGFEGDHRQFRLRRRWLRAAQDFNPSNLESYGAASEEEALFWFLEQLHRGQQPRNHPSRDAYFPRGTWQQRVTKLENSGLIQREPTGEAALTDSGSDFVQRRLYDDVDGPQRLPFRVHAAPMASGSAVISDPAVWGRLKAMGMRKIAAVEMEAASIATIADDRRLAWLVVKGVMDHADTRKDDRYKQFAARASAQVMWALLERLAPDMERGEPQRVVKTTAIANQAIAPASSRGSGVEARVRAAKSASVDIVSLLNEVAASDPTPSRSASANGRLYLVARPVGAADDALASVSTMSAVADLDAVVRQAVAARGGRSFSPDLGSGVWRRRSRGMVNERGIRDDGSVREDSLLVLQVQENGSISLLCGRATTNANSRWRRVGSIDQPGEYQVVFPNLILGLVCGTLRVAADLADRYADYDGTWAIGVRLTGIRAAIAYDYVQNGDEDEVEPYDSDIYEKTITSSTAEILGNPEYLTEQLVGALLRGLSIDSLYLPYKKS
ncbi:hypothetical protein [Dactylosporangium sp. NPDC051541]|uniref:5'-methylthioadenosine/S-adenosylhomocysteine nucleosidase family protein n=1 Tax=Dactylosporangium sp. NPDC051541 TaxID=3363977 RepID=UPI00378D2A12